jgi:hypothetical protein
LKAMPLLPELDVPFCCDCYKHSASRAQRFWFLRNEFRAPFRSMSRKSPD